jgi:hypothetical protein
MGTSTSWNPQGFSKPVMGLLYLFTEYNTLLKTTISLHRQGNYALDFSVHLLEPKTA